MGAGLVSVMAAIYAHYHDPKHYDLACSLANESDKKLMLSFPDELMQFVDRNVSRILFRRKHEAV